jgi:hypothetical protein
MEKDKMSATRFDELIWLNRNELVFIIEELEATLERYKAIVEEIKQSENYALKEKIEVAVEALKFYANEEIWLDQDLICYPIALDDEGKISIEALKKIEGPKF